MPQFHCAAIFPPSALKPARNFQLLKNNTHSSNSAAQQSCPSKQTAGAAVAARFELRNKICFKPLCSSAILRVSHASIPNIWRDIQNVHTRVLAKK
jgi:hypothetical protein